MIQMTRKADLYFVWSHHLVYRISGIYEVLPKNTDADAPFISHQHAENIETPLKSYLCRYNFFRRCCLNMCIYEKRNILYACA